VEHLLEKTLQVLVIGMIKLKMHLYHQDLLQVGHLMKKLVYGKHQLLIQMMDKDILGTKQQLVGMLLTTLKD